MSLSCVHMPADVYYACTLHAKSVEEEEVMGLLIGKFEEDHAFITSVIVLQRSDKRKDRVEISTEQLHSAMVKTSELSEATGESINVLGWYHSHPHITVQPSHVDLRTQASYQLMDSRFVGIIFSVFNEDKVKGQEIQVTCFQAESQSRGEPFRKSEVPLIIESVNKISHLCEESIFQLPEILRQEDLINYENSCIKANNNLITRLQNDAEFVTSQCHLLTTVVNPLCLSAEYRLLANQRFIRNLRAEKKELQEMLKNKLSQEAK